jgi:NADH dehydrogenase
VAAIGRFRAICSVGRLKLSGFFGWVVWMFVHLAFLTGWGSRLPTVTRWLRWLVGKNRPERTFSVAHTGGDLSAPPSVLAKIERNPFPAADGRAASENSTAR